MLGMNRQQRPVEFGPFPLERLERDPGVVAKEAANDPRAPLAPPTATESSPLIWAVQKHLHIFEDLREPEPFARKAPVPDDLALRTRDIKGAAYFLDASQVGVCELPDVQDSETGSESRQW